IKKAEAVIMADPEDIAIIFNNLISNAVKYNRREGKVEITIDKSPGEAVVIFSDTGIGIRPEDMESLFTEFVRIKRDETKNITGSGLGLSIVKKVVDLYKGTISVESIPEKGSIFTVRLPINQ
ncbi:MAG TPA: ATP-binding protein, partial [Bacteroidales bacterium]|nr:ATP-binding protein [Bacteroidales bacterium]